MLPSLSFDSKIFKYETDEIDPVVVFIFEVHWDKELESKSTKNGPVLKLFKKYLINILRLYIF